MLVRLTVRDAASGVAHDIEVNADPETTVASLLAALPFGVNGRSCYVGDQPLDAALTLADSPLVGGATISIGEPDVDPRTLPDGAAGALRVLSGPDAGLVAWLGPGRHVL